MRSAVPIFCEYRISLRLQREATAYLGSAGTADPRLSLRVKDDSSPVPVRAFECCVFKFRLPHDQAILEGSAMTPLIYGRPVMIVHEMSGLYVAVDKEPSDSFPGCCTVRLVTRDAAGSSCLFRVLPRYKVRSDGDIVFSNDAVHVVHQSSRLALHVSTVQHGGVIDDVLSEVNCHDETTSFEVSIYDDKMQLSAEAEMFAPLRCGRAFAIFHRERESFLSLESPTGKRKLLKKKNKNNNGNNNSNNNNKKNNSNSSIQNLSSTLGSSSIIPRFETLQSMIQQHSTSSSNNKSHQLNNNNNLMNDDNNNNNDDLMDDDEDQFDGDDDQKQQQQQQRHNHISSIHDQDKIVETATPITVAAAAPLDAPNSFWLVERLDPTIGGAIRAGLKCRLRHVVTNRYLVASTNPATRKLELTLEHLFSDFDADQSIYVIEHVIESAASTSLGGGGGGGAGGYTQIDQMNQVPGGAAASAGQSHDPELVHLGRSLIVFRHFSTGMYLSCSNDEAQSIALTPAASLEDAVTVVNIPREYQRSVQFLLGNCEFLRDYIEVWKKSQREGMDAENFFFSPVVRRCIDHAKGALTSLIRHCSASIDDDPLLREGLPIPSHQQAMFEIALHKLIFDVVVCPFVSHERGAHNKLELPLQGGILKLSDITNHKDTHTVCRLCYRLLKQMSKQCKISSILTEYIDFMLSQEGYKLHIADTLGEIFTDNPDLPPERCKQIITHFVKLLQKSRSSGYLNFLSELCVVNGRGATHNQRAVVKEILPVAEQIFLKLTDAEDTMNGLLMIDVPLEKEKKKDKEKDKDKEKKEEKKATGADDVAAPKKERKEEVFTRMPLTDFVVDKAGSKIERFFRSSIELMGALSIGSEPSALALVRRLLPIDRIFIMLNSQFPHVASLRQGCLHVIRHAYFSEWLHLAALYPEPLDTRGDSWAHCGSLFLKEYKYQPPNSTSLNTKNLPTFHSWHHAGDKTTADNKRRCAEVLNIVLHYYAEAASHDFNFCIELARLLRVFAQSAKLTGAHNPNITHSTIATIVTATISILKIRVMSEGRHVKNEKTWPAIKMLHEVLITLRDFVEYALITTSQVIATETETLYQIKKNNRSNSTTTSGSSSSNHHNQQRRKSSSATRRNSHNDDNGDNSGLSSTSKFKSRAVFSLEDDDADLLEDDHDDEHQNLSKKKSSKNNKVKDDDDDLLDDNIKKSSKTGSSSSNNNIDSTTTSSHTSTSKKTPVNKKVRRANAAIDLLEKDIFCCKQLLPLLIELTLYDSNELVSVSLEVIDLLSGARSFVADELKRFRVVPQEYANAFRLLCCASQRILAAHSPCSTGLLPESSGMLTDLVETLTLIDRDFLLNDTHSTKASKFREALFNAWKDPKNISLKALLKNYLMKKTNVNTNFFNNDMMDQQQQQRTPTTKNNSNDDAAFGSASFASSNPTMMFGGNRSSNNRLSSSLYRDSSDESVRTQDKPCNSLFALMLTLSSVVSSLVHCFVTYHHATERKSMGGVSDLRKSLLNFFAVSSIHPFIAKELLKTPKSFNEIQLLLFHDDCTAAACRTVFNVVSHFPRSAADVSEESFTKIFDTMMKTKNVGMAQGIELLLLSDFPIEHNQKLFLTLCEKYSVSRLVSDIIENQILVASSGAASSIITEAAAEYNNSNNDDDDNNNNNAAEKLRKQREQQNHLTFVEVIINLVSCSCVNEQSRAHIASRLLPVPLVMKVLSRLRRGSALAEQSPSLMMGMCKYLQTVVFGGEISKPSASNPHAPLHSTIREWNTNAEWFTVLRSLIEYVGEWSTQIPTMEKDQFLCVVQGLIPLIVTFYCRIFHPPLATETNSSHYHQAMKANKEKEKEAAAGAGGSSSLSSPRRPHQHLAPDTRTAARTCAKFFENFSDHFSCISSWSTSLSVLSLFPSEMLRMFGVQMFSYTHQLFDAVGSAQALDGILNTGGGGRYPGQSETGRSRGGERDNQGSSPLSTDKGSPSPQSQHTTNLGIFSPQRGKGNNNNNNNNHQDAASATPTTQSLPLLSSLEDLNQNDDDHHHHNGGDSMALLSPSIQTFTSFRKSPSMRGATMTMSSSSTNRNPGSGLTSPIRLPEALQSKNTNSNKKDKKKNDLLHDTSFGETMEVESGGSSDSGFSSDSSTSTTSQDTSGKKRKKKQSDEDDDDDDDEGMFTRNNSLLSQEEEISLMTNAFSSQPLHSLSSIIDDWTGDDGKLHEPVVRLLLGMDKAVVLQTLFSHPSSMMQNQKQQKSSSAENNNNIKPDDDLLRTNKPLVGNPFGSAANFRRTETTSSLATNVSSASQDDLGSMMMMRQQSSSNNTGFQQQLDPLLVHHTNTTHLPHMASFEARYPFLHKILKKIVTHMLQNDLSNNGASAALELFCALCEVASAAAETEDSFYVFQTYLEGLGALRMVTEVLRTSVSNEMRKKTIKFGIATLHGGNVTVQDRLLHFFNTTDEIFFRECRRHIGLSTEILHHHRVRLRYRNFYASAALSVGNPLAVMGYLALIDVVPQKEDCAESDSFTVALLRFLQLMCEGHHLGMQDYFRSQGDNFHSVNVVALVQHYFSELVLDFEPENDSDSKFEVLEQVLALLIEVCQGPCTGNQQILVFNGACKIVQKLLSIDPFCDNFCARAPQLLSIQKLCVIFLQALLEGQQDVRVPLRVIHECPVPTFDYLLSRVSSRMEEHENIMRKVSSKKTAAGTAVISTTTTGKNQPQSASLPSPTNSEGSDDSDNNINNKTDNNNNSINNEKLQEQEQGDYEEISQLITDVIYGAVIALHTTVQLIPTGTAAAATQCVDAEALLAKYSSSVGRLGMIEIERNDKIERIFFRVPEVCEKLTEESKQDLLWSIDRSSQGSKLYDLLDRTDAIIYELEVIENLHKFWKRVNPTVEFLMNRISLRTYDNAILTNAVLINILCVFFADAAGLLDVETEWLGWEGLLRGLAWWQLILTSVVFALDSLVNVPLAVYHAQKKEMLEKAGGRHGNNNNSSGSTHQSAAQHTTASTSSAASGGQSSASSSSQQHRSVLSAAQHQQLSGSQSSLIGYADYTSGRISLAHLVFRTARRWIMGALGRAETTSRMASIIVSLFGIYWNDLFFSIHLLGFIAKSAILRNIIQAVTQNGQSLLLTTALGAILIYLFAIVGFVMFSDHFDNTCTTLDQCVIHILSTGLRQGGGVGDLMTTIKQGDPRYGSRVLYDTLFWAFMIVVFLNILFGIIIDTFAELRDAKSKKEEDMQTRCLVCGLDAFTLDRYGEGFNAHIEAEHNIWNYLYFLHHLRLKEKDEYTGQESYVDRCVQTQDISFFPNKRCTSLQRYLQNQEKQNRKNALFGGSDGSSDDDGDGDNNNNSVGGVGSDDDDNMLMNNENDDFSANNNNKRKKRRGGNRKQKGANANRQDPASLYDQDVQEHLLSMASPHAGNFGNNNGDNSNNYNQNGNGNNNNHNNVLSALEDTLLNHQQQVMSMLPDADMVANSVLGRMQNSFAQMIQEALIQNSNNNNSNKNNNNNNSSSFLLEASTTSTQMMMASSSPSSPSSGGGADRNAERLRREIEKLQQALTDSDLKKLDAMKTANSSRSDLRELGIANSTLMNWMTQINHYFLQYTSLKTEYFRDSSCVKQSNNNNTRPVISFSSSSSSSSSPDSVQKFSMMFSEWYLQATTLFSEHTVYKTSRITSEFTSNLGATAKQMSSSNNRSINSSKTTAIISNNPLAYSSTTSSSKSPAADLLASRHYGSLLKRSEDNNNDNGSSISNNGNGNGTPPPARSGFWQRKSQTDLLRASDEYLRNLELQVQSKNRSSSSFNVVGRNGTSRTASGAK